METTGCSGRQATTSQGAVAVRELAPAPSYEPCAVAARTRQRRPGAHPTDMSTTEENHAMTTIHAELLQPGDVVVYRGHQHQITHIDRRDGWAWPIAADKTGWAIALGHYLIDVHRHAA
jgi:hypothetical protein